MNRHDDAGILGDTTGDLADAGKDEICARGGNEKRGTIDHKTGDGGNK